VSSSSDFYFSDFLRVSPEGVGNFSGIFWERGFFGGDMEGEITLTHTTPEGEITFLSGTNLT
jgi:hypothetical protein